MIWRRRCLVLVPVLSFLAAALTMSCGGGSTGTPAQAPVLSIFGLNVCSGPPPTPTPTPTATMGHTPTVTPTPICTPIATSGVVCVPKTAFCGTTVDGVTVEDTVSFNAQGVFGFTSTTKNPKYRDVSNSVSTFWHPFTPPNPIFPGVISYQGSDGLFLGVTPGCTFFSVSDGGFFSQNVVVGVNVDPATCPSPPTPPATLAVKPNAADIPTP
jgi:hypothetical protein